MKRDFDLSDTEVSLLIGIAFSLFYVTCGVPLARIADRSNRRNILAIGVAAWSIMTAAAGLAQNFLHLLFSRIGVGVGESTIAPCAHSIMADILPPEKLGRGFAIFSMGSVLGGAIAYGIGGLLIAWSDRTFPEGVAIPMVGQIFSWQLVFVIVGLPGILVALVFFLTVNEPVRKSALGDAGAMSLAEVGRFFRAHIKVYLSIYGGLAILGIAAGGLTAWLPALMERRYEIGPAEAGPYLLMSFILPGIASAVVAGWLGDLLLKKGRHDAHLRVSAIATGIGIIPFGVATLAPTPGTMVILLGTGYFFVFTSMILCPAALQLVSPARMRSLSASLVMFSTMLVGHGTGPTIVAMITDFGFRDESMVHISVAIVSLACASATTIAYALGRKPFGKMIKTKVANASESG